MDTGDEIEVRSKYSGKTVQVARVSRGRVSVRWPHVGEFEVDLVNGELVRRPEPAFGVFSVDSMTGRVVDTRSAVTGDDMWKLDTIKVGETLQLDSGATAEVVDVLRSEGILRIFVQGARGVTTRPWRTGYRVVPLTLVRLREAAGCVTGQALAS